MAASLNHAGTTTNVSNSPTLRPPPSWFSDFLEPEVASVRLGTLPHPPVPAFESTLSDTHSTRPPPARSELSTVRRIRPRNVDVVDISRASDSDHDLEAMEDELMASIADVRSTRTA